MRCPRLAPLLKQRGQAFARDKLAALVQGHQMAALRGPPHEAGGLGFLARMRRRRAAFGQFMHRQRSKTKRPGGKAEALKIMSEQGALRAVFQPPDGQQRQSQLIPLGAEYYALASS